jgi:hypothetical protein
MCRCIVNVCDEASVEVGTGTRPMVETTINRGSIESGPPSKKRRTDTVDAVSETKRSDECAIFEPQVGLEFNYTEYLRIEGLRHDMENFIIFV